MTSLASGNLSHGSSRRPNHRLQRSISEMPPPKSEFHAHQRQHHHHAHHHLHKPGRDERGSQSGGQTLAPSNSSEGNKADGRTLDGSNSGSGSTSLTGAPDENAIAAEKEMARKQEELKTEKERTALRAAELSKSLKDLRTLSSTTTRRLDTTYYSVLEKLSTLQSSIASLQELSTMTRQLNEDFNSESQQIVKEVESQIAGLNDFQSQQTKIENLKSRVSSGRAKVDKLGERVEIVKEKIEDWSKVEEQWQEKTRRRIKAMWGVSAVILVALTGILIFQYTPSRTEGPTVIKSLNASEVAVSMTDLESTIVGDTITLKRQASNVLDELRRRPEEDLEEDPRLRALDEL